VRSIGQRSPATWRGFVSLTSALALACAVQPATAGAACESRHYALVVHPHTIVSNERHRVHFRATLTGCGHSAAVSGARVRLDRYRATTDARGRVSLTVRLATGRYVVRLYVRHKAVAHARLTAIPNVSR
jgi:hypothetical protein